jgi:hypothetical protein
LIGWESRLHASPELFPLTLDPATDQVELLRLQRIDYERASFLDGRLARPSALSVAYSELAAATAGLPVACDYIFHVGHVGSTLLSRLLGLHPAVFSLREPQVLRLFVEADLAQRPWPRADFDARLSTFLALFSRTWAPPQRALVKATSMVGELADRLISGNPSARGLLMTVTPETYMATILGGPNSRTELSLAGPMRLARLHRRLGEPRWRLADLSEGELCAMSWACEMAGLAQAAERCPDRTLWIDFDRLLSAPAAGLAQALRLLHGSADDAAIERMRRSGYLERYSKAPEYGYGPDLRRQVLDQARRDHGGEIARGLAWLETASREKQIAQVLAGHAAGAS